MNKLLISFIFLVFFSLGAQSQNNKNQAQKTTRTLYMYTFSGVENETQLQGIEQQMASLKFVETTKTKYKPEKKAAHIILTVISENISREATEEFNPAVLKQIILKNNLTPGDLTVRELTEEK